MKDFLKFTFASVIGVILAGVVFTILAVSYTHLEKAA